MEHIKLSLLKPAYLPLKLPLPPFPGHPGILPIQQPTIELPSLLESGGIHEVWSLDFETKGDYGEAGSYPVGIGLASPRGSVYIPISDSHPDTLRVLAENLAQQNIRLIAHNLFFDAGWFMRDVSQSFIYRDGLGSKEPGAWLNWHACTYALYRLLASEGYPGQQYGLKKAQVDLLGWESSNELLLDRWLIENEHVSNTSKVAKEGYYFYPDYAAGARTFKETPPDVLGEHDRFVSPRKDAMHLAPSDILGTYCRLDAVSTLDLYTHVLEPAMAKFEGLQWYMHELYMRFIYLLVWQKVSGMTVDQDALDAHRVSLEQRIAKTKEEFLGHPDVAPHVAAYNETLVSEQRAKEPKRIKGQWPPGAPVQYKKDGTETAAWQTYQAKLAKGPEISLNWLKWEERLAELEGKNHFNLNSGAQKAWLFYEAMGYPIKATTESGQPATDEVALRQFGEPGKLLSDYVSAEKELGFNASLGGVINPLTEKYHPSVRVPGTHTGRLAGAGGFNCQNLPKSLDFLRAFTVPEGYVIITCDHASLEDYVLAELSRDASLWDFYGTNSRKGNCMYLSVGSRLPVLGQKIKEAGYDPDNWTPASVSAAKKTAGKWRQVAKKIVLSCIAEGTLVRVKDRGYMPIEKITKDMLIWDGTTWVKTDGAVFMGEKECMNLNGNWMTYDHRVLTKTGWTVAERCDTAQCERPKQTSYSWSDVWNMARRIFRG